MEYSLGDLVDMLSIMNVKMYHLIDIVEGDSDAEVVSKTSKKLASLNRERSAIKNAINEAIGSSRRDFKT